MDFFVLTLFISAIFGHGYAFVDKNVYECLANYNLTDFAQLIKDAGLNTLLASETGVYTLLAPTNAAIKAIAPDTMVSLAHNPVMLRQLIRYHILTAFNPLPLLIRGGNAKTLEGQEVTFANVDSIGTLVNNQSKVIGDSDIICKNGIIHMIDTVLTPPVFSTNNLAQVLITRDDIFKDFFLYALLGGMTTLLEKGEYTIFAPTDLAFGRYSELSEIRRNNPNAAHIYLEVLKYHMIPGARTTNQLHNGDHLYTLHGAPVNINKTANGIMVDHARVIQADIPASNGVIHAIDHVLFPVDQLKLLADASGGP